MTATPNATRIRRTIVENRYVYTEIRETPEPMREPQVSIDLLLISGAHMGGGLRGKNPLEKNHVYATDWEVRGKIPWKKIVCVIIPILKYYILLHTM